MTSPEKTVTSLSRKGRMRWGQWIPNSTGASKRPFTIKKVLHPLTTTTHQEYGADGADQGWCDEPVEGRQQGGIAIGRARGRGRRGGGVAAQGRRRHAWGKRRACEVTDGAGVKPS
jgi:hypothetical protein